MVIQRWCDYGYTAMSGGDYVETAMNGVIMVIQR
jgi:hypothetical protein